MSLSEYVTMHGISRISVSLWDGQKAFFDTVVEYSTCKYLRNYMNGKHSKQTTWYLGLKEKEVTSKYF